MNPVDTARFTARTLGFVGLTTSLLVGMETERALAPEARKDPVLYDWMERYGHGLLALYGVEVQAQGAFVKERRYPGTDARGVGRVFVMNHRSLLDVFITLRFFEATIVSRADLARWPVIGLAARRVKTLFVDRSDKRSGAAVVTAMVDALARGRAVMIYPEGTTFAGDEVRPFRLGAFHAAERAGAEVVPVGLAYGGDGAAFLDEPFTRHLQRVASAKRTRAAIVIGETLAAPVAGEAERRRDEAREHVQGLVHQARALLR